MDLTFTEAHEELRQVVRRFFKEKSPEIEIRRLMETAEGYDPEVWRQMADQLGLQGLIIPEEFGGSGYGYLELIVVLEEMGRALVCAPYFATVALATNLLLVVGDDAAKRDYLPSIADGSTIATVALAEESGRGDDQDIGVDAVKTGDGWILNGEKSYVLDAYAADLIFTAARTPSGTSLFAVDTSDPGGCTRTPLTPMDQTRKLAKVTLESTPARLIGAEGEAGPALAKALDLAVVALAAEQIGGAQRVLAMAVEYAKIRVQFGRPIGSFQAIKHKCADMFLDVESAKLAAYHAGWAASEDSAELPITASMAKSYCSEAYFRAAAENIQIHGGIGFTWEHPAHLYLKRAKSAELLFGDPSHHREVVAQRLGI